ncbi:MAG: hypothetical protein J6K85_04280 [Clostridia bacterium]|nr:hypothetical protein [Clostridia bacterium]
MKIQMNKQNLVTSIISLLLIVGVIGACIALFSGDSGSNSGSNSNSSTHKHTFETVTVLTDCTQGGTKTETCKECKYTKTTNIAPTEHSLISGEAVAATCTQNGSTAFEKCMVCDYGNSAKIIPALGHDLYVASEATVSCTTNGQTALKKCNNCNYQEGGETILATGHNYILQIAYEPTCSETGKSFEFCEYCHNIINETVIPVDSSKHVFVGNVCELCDYELFASFSIDNENYSIIGDITWRAWLTSSFNTAGYVQVNNYISLSTDDLNGVFDPDTGEFVSVDEKIIHGKNYTYGSILIKFSILIAGKNNKELSAPLGMTWRTWIRSDYNPDSNWNGDNFVILEDNTLRIGYSDILRYSDGSAVYADDEIIKNSSYELNAL